MSTQTEQRLEIELSNRKESMLCNQLSRAIDASEINQIGESRYEGKQAAIADGAHGSHEINQRIGITSYASMTKFQTNAHKFTGFCFERYGLNDIRSIKPEHIKEFLIELCDRDYARQSVQGYASTIEKLAVVMDAYSPAAQPRTETWHAAVVSCRAEINDCVQKDTGSRAYADPQAMIDNLSEPRLQLVAEMQLNYGLRISDATKVDANNLNGNILLVPNSKNGQDLRIELSADYAQRVRDMCTDGGVKNGVYREALKQACAESGQEWTGTHGLRHNYAQNRVAELVDSGTSYNRAVWIVSEEMGHHRPEVTAAYLR